MTHGPVDGRNVVARFHSALDMQTTGIDPHFSNTLRRVTTSTASTGSL
jgi:hypothetical protein